MARVTLDAATLETATARERPLELGRPWAPRGEARASAGATRAGYTVVAAREVETGLAEGDGRGEGVDEAALGVVTRRAAGPSE